MKRDFLESNGTANENRFLFPTVYFPENKHRSLKCCANGRRQGRRGTERVTSGESSAVRVSARAAPRVRKRGWGERWLPCGLGTGGGPPVRWPLSRAVPTAATALVTRDYTAWPTRDPHPLPGCPPCGCLITSHARCPLKTSLGSHGRFIGRDSWRLPLGDPVSKCVWHPRSWGIDPRCRGGPLRSHQHAGPATRAFDGCVEACLAVAPVHD